MANNVQLRWALWTYLLTSCCVTYAAELSLAEGLDTLTVKLVSVSLGFACLGGMASTIPKIVNPKIVVPNKALEVVKDIVASLFAGLVILLFCIWREYSWSLTFLLIGVGGAGNAKIVDLAVNNRLAEVAFGILERFMSAFSGKDTSPPPSNKANNDHPGTP